MTKRVSWANSEEIVTGDIISYSRVLVQITGEEAAQGFEAGGPRLRRESGRKYNPENSGGGAGSVIGNLFRKKRDDAGGDRPTTLTGPRIPRHSSGWQAMLQHLRDQNELRVLDIGPTSPQNINFLTGMGHSVYMADVAHEAMKPEWVLPPAEKGAPPGFNVKGFFEQNLNFHGRDFDVVLLWATLDYIPEGLTKALVEHLLGATRPGAKVLAIFHSKKDGPYTAYCRYHLTDVAEIEMQESEPFPVQRVYTNRSIERLFEGFAGNRFFLAKDNLYEVILTR